MRTMSLPAFLKILTLGTPQKVKEYGRYLTPGGYDFYMQLKQAAYGITVAGESHTDWFKTIGDIPRDAERKYNVDGTKNLVKWIAKCGPISYFAAPTKLVSTPGKHLGIKLEPEFGAIIGDTRYLLQVWYSKQTNLSKTAISVGNWLLEKYLCKSEFAECHSANLDLRRKQIMQPEFDPLAMDLMVDSEFAWIDKFFQAHKDRATTSVA